VAAFSLSEGHYRPPGSKERQLQASTGSFSKDCIASG